ncbi:hypothetical protein [uncultured Corynebacterium sp.]|uniref:hypothetical protein n=1 Tax=uncultured Corynebacterium sp. TaxID=159447 RepID=UPI0025F7BCA6|nr:hypothetical protein [uncultured Corynebacterium sp.]
MSTTRQKSQAQSQRHGPFKRRTRIIQLVFLAAAVIATLALAYWQLSRWSSTSSFQNLGYALQWPAFGIFFIWAYRKYMEYERERFAGNEEAGVTVRDGDMTEIPEDFLPSRPGTGPIETSPAQSTDAAGTGTTAATTDATTVDEEKK